jgi:hypothetical protein
MKRKDRFVIAIIVVGWLLLFFLALYTLDLRDAWDWPELSEPF